MLTILCKLGLMLSTIKGKLCSASVM